MRRGSIRKAYKHGLIEPVARKIDRQEIDKQPGSQCTRAVKARWQWLDRGLNHGHDRVCKMSRLFRLRWIGPDELLVREEKRDGTS